VTPVQNVDLPASGTVVQQVSAPIGFAYAVEDAGCVLDTAAALRVSAGDCGASAVLVQRVVAARADRLPIGKPAGQAGFDDSPSDPAVVPVLDPCWIDRG
jgi:hypothetical protein